MSRPIVLILAGLAAGLAILHAGTRAAAASTLCVGERPGCYPAIQDALDASHDGDVIMLGHGTFAGGITITTSVRLRGLGPGLTTIAGGGPVVTIGRDEAAHEPTVSIRGVRITGGVTHGDGVVGRGGGILIEAAADPGDAAQVTIEDAVIDANRVEPTDTRPSPSHAPCPGGPCPFAFAGGGGIFNLGALTLQDVDVRDNVVAGTASDADGGGIWSGVGSLTLRYSRVAGNRAVASIPFGRFAEGGGLFVNSGGLNVDHSAVDGNATTLSSTLPFFLGDGQTLDSNTNSGGIHIGDDVAATINWSTIRDNTTTVTNLEGEALAFDAAMIVGESTFALAHSVVSGNRVIATVGDTADVGPDGTAVELDNGGTITDTRITGNTVTVTSPDGVAGATGGLAVYDFSNSPTLAVVRRSLIAGNTASASTTDGSATVQGVGILNNSLLDLRDVDVRGNRGHVSGPSGFAQGGGIWNGVLLSGPPVELALHDSTISGNSLSGSAGLPLQGGGLFTTEPVTLDGTTIFGNVPDQCVGC